jgi:hypothetical protein
MGMRIGRRRRRKATPVHELDDEASYFLERAKQELERAAGAEHPQAAAAHRALSTRYSVKALLTQADTGDEPAKAFPQIGGSKEP